MTADFYHFSLPLTIYPLNPRLDSPAPSMSSRSGASSNVDSRTQNDQDRTESVEIISIDDLPSPLHPTTKAEAEAGPSTATKVEDNEDVRIIPDEEVLHVHKDKGKGKASEVVTHDSPLPDLPENLLSSYSCPICFSTVTNACLTPCGHVLCGLCLFSAVKSGIQRGLDLGIPLGREGTTARYV